jgi:hypothetical protein
VHLVKKKKISDSYSKSTKQLETLLQVTLRFYRSGPQVLKSRVHQIVKLKYLNMLTQLSLLQLQKQGIHHSLRSRLPRWELYPLFFIFWQTLLGPNAATGTKPKLGDCMGCWTLNTCVMVAAACVQTCTCSCIKGHSAVSWRTITGCAYSGLTNCHCHISLRDHEYMFARYLIQSMHQNYQILNRIVYWVMHSFLNLKDSLKSMNNSQNTGQCGQQSKSMPGIHHNA